MGSRVPVVAIVGRTNVGKSTLFNALTRRRLAIVEDSPGVTRDRHYRLVKGFEVPFTLVDTGGLVGEEDEDVGQKLHEIVEAQSRVAIDQADLVLAVMDGKAGPHPFDSDIVQELRRSGKPVLWVVNKCERPLTGVLAAEFYALGIGDLVCVSAAHRIGLDELGEKIVEELRQAGKAVSADAQLDDGIRVAIVGRPNVGKSTIINKILGEERVVVSTVSGTTRDSIDVPLVRNGRRFILVDTAGLRKKSRVAPLTVERFSNLRTLRALAGSDVAILVLDATEGAPSEQEKKIAELIHERGRSFIIAVNKWDLVEKDHRTVQAYKQAIYRELPFARYAPILFISALTGRRCPNLLEKTAEVYDAARVRIQTSVLNDLLQRIFAHRPPPVVRGGPVKLFFATQVGVAPPRIAMFLNYPKELQPSYFRYVKQHLRKEFPFEGVDIKVDTRKRTEKAQRAQDEREAEA